MEEKVLVQDADEAILDVLRLALQAEGFNVVPVLNCNDKILELIDEFRPHAVLLDYRLAGQDCIDICKRIKQQYPHLPVIALSCNINISEQYDKDGFDGYIPKPFDLDLLYKTLREHLPASSIAIDHQ